MKATAWRAASSMCCRRTRSSCCDILDLGLAHDAVPEVAAQGARRVQIDLAPEDCGELILDIDEREARDVTGLELDEYVDVAAWAEVVAEHGAEERQLADVMPLAELSDSPTVDGDSRRHRSNGSPCAGARQQGQPGRLRLSALPPRMMENAGHGV